MEKFIGGWQAHFAVIAQLVQQSDGIIILTVLDSHTHG